MKKFLLFVLTFGLLCFNRSSHLWAFSVSYDQKVSVENKAIAVIKVVVQDNKMWAQSNFGDGESVMLRNEEGAFSYIPAQKMATKIPSSMDRPNLTRDLPRFMDFLKENGGKKISSETLDGKQTDVYEFKEPTLQTQSKAWVWTEKSFPVKIEVPAPEGKTTVELSNIQFDPAIKENQFKLPADVKIVDLENSQVMAQGNLPEGGMADNTDTKEPA